MIGMMNGGQMDDGADYVFGEHRRRVKLLTQQKGDGATKEGGEAVGSLEHEPSLYPIQVRKKVSYGCDGRRMLDGKPESERTTDELWNDTLKRMACFTTCQVPIKKDSIMRSRLSRLSKMLSPSGTSIKRVFSFGRNKLEKEKPEHPRRKKPTKHVAAIEEEDEGEEEAEGGGGVEEKEASKNNNVNSSQQQVFPSNKDNKNNIATVTVGTKALVEKFNGTR